MPACLTRFHQRFRLPRLLGEAVLAWALILTAAAHAEAPGASSWAKTEHGAVRLLTGVEGTGTKGESTVPLGLEFRMAEGWKVYWRSPGDAGYPPAVDWVGSQNLAGTAIDWPAPTRFSILDFETIGYETAVILPIEARLQRPGEPLVLDAAVDFLTCKDICVPEKVRLTLTVPAGPATAGPSAAAIAAARALVPGEPGAGSPRIDSVTLQPAAGGKDASLRIVARSPMPFSAPDVFVEGPPELAFGAPVVRLGDGGRTAVLDVAVHGIADLHQPLTNETLTFTLTDRGDAIEQRVPVSGETAAAAGPATNASVAATSSALPTAPPALLPMLVIAWLGGLILNLMPCVLPVLSIKLLGVVAHGGGERTAIRLSFLASAAGILVSFWVLAATLVAVKAAGGLVGWGLQFQQPWFLVTMTLIVAVFAANLWGWFEVPLPRVIADAGAASAHVRGLGGQFLSGALATLLATPCSAPFVGTAIGFALTGGGAATIGTVFTAMALGLATPYLLVAAAPTLAQRLPRPGAWMRTVRRVLALALLATGGWLVSVLAANIGVPAAVAIGGLALLLIATVAWASRAAPRRKAAPVLLALAAVVTAFLVPSQVSRGGRPGPAMASADRGRPFDPAQIPALVAAGKTVLVNVTAEWCLTCKVNEQLVLDRPPVRDHLNAPGVVVMQGDWTRPDDGISRYLATFGRYGIPFDAVYGPGMPQGMALPELLTPEIVLDALDRAARTGSVAAASAQRDGSAATTR